MDEKRRDGSGWYEQIMDEIKADLEMLCGEFEENNGVLRTMTENLGAQGGSAVLEAAIEGLPNGEDLPYPAVHFNFTLAKDVEPEHFGTVADVLNDVNVVLSTGEYPSFGNFCLYKPLKQIYYGYRMPINIDHIEGEIENIRFFLATVFEQLDVFSDLILYAADGNAALTLDNYMDYLKTVSDFNDITDRLSKLEEILKS